MSIVQTNDHLSHRDKFLQTYGGIFENSKWVAERAFELCGDAQYLTPLEVHEKLVEVVMRSSQSEKLALLRAHPELAGKEAMEGRMTDDSVEEQASAGLNALTRDEMALLAKLNANYKEKHKFPFIVAVRNRSKDDIINIFLKRLSNDTESEFVENLNQIYEITRLRVLKIHAY